MKMIKVQRMPQTITFEGATYGPSEKPIKVPEELAKALGLLPVDGEPLGDEEADSPAAEDLKAARTLATQYKTNLDTLLGVLAPEAEDGELPDQVLARLVQERNDAGTAASQLTDKLSALSREYDDFKSAANTAGAEGTNARLALEQQVATLTGERDAARAALAEGKVIPEDALDRLVAVPGIAKTLAEKALAALTAPAGE